MRDRGIAIDHVDPLVPEHVADDLRRADLHVAILDEDEDALASRLALLQDLVTASSPSRCEGMQDATRPRQVAGDPVPETAQLEKSGRPRTTKSLRCRRRSLGVAGIR